MDDGRRISDQARLSRQKRTHQIGNQLVAGPVAATDGIAGARAAERHAVAVERFRRKIGFSKRGRDEFGAALRIRIRISPAHRLAFAITPKPFAIFVALVAGHVHDDTRLLQLPKGFENDGPCP